MEAHLSKKTIKYLKDLKNNNKREWYLGNKQRLEDDVMFYARNLVTGMGLELEKCFPNIIADPRVDQSIYRMYRDVRFSKDKTPYKENLAIWFWEDKNSFARVESPGFYLHFEEGGWLWSVGCYRFNKQALLNYRKALTVKKSAQEFENIIKSLEKGNISLNEPHLKREVKLNVYKQNLAYWLRYKGLYSGDFNTLLPYEEIMFTEDAVSFFIEKFKIAFNLHTWLVKNL